MQVAGYTLCVDGSGLPPRHVAAAAAMVRAAAAASCFAARAVASMRDTKSSMRSSKVRSAVLTSLRSVHTSTSTCAAVLMAKRSA